MEGKSDYHHESVESSSGSGIDSIKRHRDGIVLIPQPSEHPEDPLNWALSRRLCIFVSLAIAGLASIGAPTSNQLAYVLQAATYHKSPTEISYGASASLAGFIVGPFLYQPIFAIFGRTATLFWGIILQILTQVWAAEMTAESDYVPFVISRLFSGLLGTIPVVVGSAFIIDAFYLHQRGRLFAFFELCFLIGPFVVPTLGGFIADNKSLGWPWTFWWTCFLSGVAALLVFIFVEETNFDRSNGTCVRARKSFLANRIDTIFFGWRVVAPWTAKDLVDGVVTPMIIFVSPVTLAAGFYNMVAFGFAIIVQILVNIFVQEPVAVGGYGFSPKQNAYFTFTQWLGVLIAWTTGYLIGDRIPFAVARRNHGIWHPEYRLWNLLIPGIILPIGLGIYGAALQYHLNYCVLALGLFLTQFGAQLSIPVCVNYVVECYIKSPVQVAIAMNAWRLILALALPFATTPWSMAVGVGWTFGMAAIFTLLAGLLMVVVAWKGQTLRRLQLVKNLQVTEDGMHVTKESVAS